MRDLKQQRSRGQVIRARSSMIILAFVSVLAASLIRSDFSAASPAVPINIETLFSTPTEVSDINPPVISVKYDGSLVVPERIEDLVFSPDGSLLAAMGEKTAYVWTIGEGMAESRKDFTTEDEDFRTGRLAISLDNKILYRGTLDYNSSPTGQILHWDIVTGDELLPRWGMQDSGLYGTAIRLDLDLKNNTLNYFYALGYQQCPNHNFFFYRWDLTTNRLVLSQPKQFGQEFMVQAAAGAGYQAYHYTDAICSNFYSNTHQRTAIFKDKTQIATLSSSGMYGLENMAFSMDGHYFVGTTDEYSHSQIYIFEIVSEAVEQMIKIESPDTIRQAAISADSRYVYVFKSHRTPKTGHYRMQFDVIDLDAREWIATLDTDVELENDYSQLRFALSPDGKHLVYMFEGIVLFVPLPDWGTLAP